MKTIKKRTEVARQRRKKHIHKVISGTPDRPRLVVYRSARHIYAQLVDDHSGVVLTGISSLNPDVRKSVEKLAGKITVGKEVGKALAGIAKEKGIGRVVFDRNGFRYHGRIKAVAEGAREGGLVF